MKSKTEPASARFKRLLEVLSAYSYNLYFMMGKDTTLSHFLSRIKAHISMSYEIIPILFGLKEVLQEKYYIHTRLGAQVRITVVKVYVYYKILFPHTKPEKMAKVIYKVPSSTEMSQLHLVTNPPIRKGLGRRGLRRKVPSAQQLLK